MKTCVSLGCSFGCVLDWVLLMWVLVVTIDWLVVSIVYCVGESRPPPLRGGRGMISVYYYILLSWYVCYVV